MNCEYCGAELLQGANYCIFCGGKVAAKNTPVIDPLPVVEPQPDKQPMVEPTFPPIIEPRPTFEPQPQHVPEIDPSPRINPVLPHDPASPPVSVDGAGLPAGFTYDPETHTYYKSEIITASDGGQIERVTYYDTTTLNLTQAEYPACENRGIPDYIQGLEQDLSPSMDGSSYITGALPASKSRRSGFGVVLIGLAILVLLAGVTLIIWLTGWYSHIPILAPESQPASVWNTQPQTPSSQPRQPDTSSVASSPESMPDYAPTERHDVPDYAAWPDFGYLSNCYRNACEDEKYIYYRRDASSLLRIDKQALIAERILNTGEFGYQSVDSFTLLEDYLYFTVPMGRSRLGYFRMHRGGGQSEFILTDTGGAMLTAGGKILFWDRWLKVMASYDPREDIFPVPVSELQLPESLLLTEDISVADDYIYYRVLEGEGAGCYRYDLLDDKGVAIAYELPGRILDLVVIEDTAYFLYEQEEYMICRSEIGTSKIETLQVLGSAGGEKPFFAAVDGGLVWQQGWNYYFAPVKYPERKQLILTSEEQPDAVTREWILWPDRAYHISQGMLIDLAKVEVSPLFDSASAFGQAEMFAGVRDVRNTLLTEPVAKDDEDL